MNFNHNFITAIFEITEFSHYQYLIDLVSVDLVAVLLKTKQFSWAWGPTATQPAVSQWGWTEQQLVVSVN